MLQLEGAVRQARIQVKLVESRTLFLAGVVEGELHRREASDCQLREELDAVRESLSAKALALRDAERQRAHRDRGEGLAVSVGGLTRLDASGRRWSFVTLSHNLIRGAVGGAILTAEDAHRRGLLDD